MILVDTSVWVEASKGQIPQFFDLLKDGQVLGHQLISMELQCGTPANRDQFLDDYDQLKQALGVSWREVSDFIEINKLYGRGCGPVDLSLLLSCVLSDIKFWTLDKRLNTLAKEFGVSYA